MRNLGIACAVVCAACGDRTPAPTPHPVTPAVAASSHAAPTCPLAPPPSAQPAADPARDDADDPMRVHTSKDTCAVADTNLDRVERAILAPANRGTVAGSTRWDRKTRPKFTSLVEQRLAVQPGEKELLEANGFFVAPRLTFDSYALAFHEIYQSQLPIYVSVDAVLHAIYAGNDSLIAELEDKQLAPALASVIDQLACALPAAAPDYPQDTARDLDLYLAVARALLRGDAPASMFGDPAVEDEANKLVKRAVDASEMSPIDLFGRQRVVDFTAYTPRSHYTTTDERKRYFRAGMWLSRLEFNLVSRSSRSSQPGEVPDPRETPREDLDALALADLVARANQGDAIAKLDAAWALLAGRREDVSVAELTKLRVAAGIAKLTDPGADARLRAAIGDKYKRTARIHYMPGASPELPAIATLLGPRIVPDAAATRPLVQDAIPGRTELTASDMAFALGHDRALAHLAAERATYPTLERQLREARTIVATAPRGQDDLYSAWFDAVLALASRPTGAMPSFMATDAYADLHINSALAGFGHIKHNFVLIAGESYFAGGCAIPDGYVEPAPAMYGALIQYAARGERAMAELDPKDTLGARAYFTRLGSILRVLQQIQSDELQNRVLTHDERAFLSMVAEMEPGTTGGPPRYTGWWFDLFRDREQDGLAPPSYIASFFTGETISYVGATAPQLGVFVVDTGCAPRLVVGPVARAYEVRGEVAHRLDDAAGAALPDADRRAPWAASYTAPTAPPPKLFLEWTHYDPPITISTKDLLGPVTIELYDHHRVALKSLTKTVKPGKTTFTLRADEAEGVHIRVGSYNGWFDMPIGQWLYQSIGGYEASDE
jgi:hypothetical protein